MLSTILDGCVALEELKLRLTSAKVEVEPGFGNTILALQETRGKNDS